MKRVLVLALVGVMSLSMIGCSGTTRIRRAIHELTADDVESKTVEDSDDSEDSDSPSNVKGDNEKYSDVLYDESNSTIRQNSDRDSSTNRNNTAVAGNSIITVYVPDNGDTFMIPTMCRMPEGYNAEDVVRKVIEKSNGAFDSKSKVLDVHQSGKVTFVNMSADFNSPEITAMKIYCIINTLCSNSSLGIEKVVFLIDSHNVDYLGNYDNRVAREKDPSLIRE